MMKPTWTKTMIAVSVIALAASFIFYLWAGFYVRDYMDQHYYKESVKATYMMVYWIFGLAACIPNVRFIKRLYDADQYLSLFHVEAVTNDELTIWVASGKPGVGAEAQVPYQNPMQAAAQVPVQAQAMAQTQVPVQKRIIFCSQCGCKLAVPTDRGRLMISCPKCRNQFPFN